MMNLTSKVLGLVSSSQVEQILRLPLQDAARKVVGSETYTK